MSTEPRRSSESIRLKNLMDAARDAREMWERGEISREEYHDALNELRSPKRSFSPDFVRFVCPDAAFTHHRVFCASRHRDLACVFYGQRVLAKYRPADPRVHRVLFRVC